MNPRRRWLILGSLLTATLAAVAWLNDQEATGPAVAAAKPRGAARPVNESRQLALDKLKRVPAAEAAPVSDVFTIQSWYVPPPPPKPAPPPPPAPPPMPFTYMGRLVEDGKTTVFLTKQNRNYAIAQGDTVEGGYRVDIIDANRVVFTYLPLNMQQTLTTGGTN